MAEHSTHDNTLMIGDLERGFAAVETLIANVRPEQWSDPTPCTEWDVRRLVEHLTGMNLVFEAILRDAPPPTRTADGEHRDDPAAAFRTSAAALVLAFVAPGALERELAGPLGSATGAERLQIRVYDLLAHGWDLAQATGQPEDVAERSLSFARTQVLDTSRAGRFAPAREVAPEAPALERLAAFLGRTPGP